MYPSPWSGSRRSSLAVIFKKSLLRQLRAIPKPPIFVHLSGVSALQLVVHSGAMDFQLRCDLRRTEPYSIQSFKFHAVFQHEMSFTQPARLLFCWLFDKKINAGKLLSSSLAFILIIQRFCALRAKAGVLCSRGEMPKAANLNTIVTLFHAILRYDRTISGKELLPCIAANSTKNYRNRLPRCCPSSPSC